MNGLDSRVGILMYIFFSPSPPPLCYYSLDALSVSSRSLCQKLLDFIHANGGLAVDDRSHLHNSVASCLVAFPTANLFFDGDSFQKWRQ